MAMRSLVFLVFCVIDFYDATAVLSRRRIKSFVFAQSKLALKFFTARLDGQIAFFFSFLFYVNEPRGKGPFSQAVSRGFYRF